MNNLISRWKSLWHPERYHGWGKKKSFFEGWYYKMVSGDGSFACSFIPGISMDDNGTSHAFIQTIDGTNAKTYYERYGSNEFACDPDKHHVRVGESTFTETYADINLPHAQGRIELVDTTPWPSEFGAPGVMGWYSFVPAMQCYHGVVSLNHYLAGKLAFEGFDHEMTGGKGYIEKDWGSSFPKCWIWMQTNHFSEHDRPVSFMASVAHIPWMGRYFVGFLVALYLDGELYKWTTYNGSKMTSSIDEDHVYLSFKKGNSVINIKGKKGQTGELISPIKGEMRGKVNESIAAEIELQVKKGEQTLFEDTGLHAGLEVAGDIDILLTK